MAKREHTDDDDKIVLQLTTEQRSLLTDEVTIADDNVRRLVSVAMKDGDTYQIPMTIEEFDLLLDDVATEANNTKNKKLRKKLDALYEYLDDVLWDAADGNVDPELGAKLKGGELSDVLGQFAGKFTEFLTNPDDFDDDDDDEDDDEDDEDEDEDEDDEQDRAFE